jgi:hypothetical protein
MAMSASGDKDIGKVNVSLTPSLPAWQLEAMKVKEEKKDEDEEKVEEGTGAVEEKLEPYIPKWQIDEDAGDH